MIFQLADFNAMHIHQKAYFLDKNATFLVNLFENDIIYSLYAYRDTYIEVIIHSETKHLLNIVAFYMNLYDWDRLDKYCEHTTVKA